MSIIGMLPLSVYLARREDVAQTFLSTQAVGADQGWADKKFVRETGDSGSLINLQYLPPPSHYLQSAYAGLSNNYLG